MVLGLVLVSLLSCASLEEQQHLKDEARQLDLGDTWWTGGNDGKEFNSLAEAEHFSKLFFIKLGQMTMLKKSKGMNGILEPIGDMPLWMPRRRFKSRCTLEYLDCKKSGKLVRFFKRTIGNKLPGDGLFNRMV